MTPENDAVAEILSEMSLCRLYEATGQRSRARKCARRVARLNAARVEAGLGPVSWWSVRIS
jgi:hypothetical protein